MLQQHQRSGQQVSKSLERLSTGKRINRPSDDPSRFIVAQSLHGDLVELHAESRASDAERLDIRQQQSALTQVQRTLNDVRGNLVAAADGFNSPAQNRAIQQEIDASLDAIDQIAGRVQGVSDSDALSELRQGGNANVVDGDVAAATELVDSKLSNLSRSRTAIGAYERTQLDTFDRLREDQIVITTEALSQVEDADFVEEATNLVQGQILSEASLKALAFSTREQIEQMEALLEGLTKE